MLRRYFDTSVIDSLTDWIVKELAKSLPSGQIDIDSRQTQDKLAHLERRIRGHLKDVQLARLNLYQKAKLGVRLQDRLEAAGYAKAFYGPFSYNVVRLITLASGQR
ncbi:MAG TPA: hypothetical protein VNT02_09095 [Burkholderiales bacterium]|nr:hypothetical protein [Burkholderiales bacterium]